MRNYIEYEVKNALGNIFTVIFGSIFPILMTLVFYSAFASNYDEIGKVLFKTNLFLTNLLIAPLAIVYIGFASLYSQEIERDVTLRMSLFGYSKHKQMRAKFIAQFIILFISLVLYTIILIPILRLSAPTLLGLILIILIVFFVALVFYLLSFAISNLTKRFSVSFGITMSTYFLILVLSGMMGITADNLPVGLKQIALALPTTHIVKHSVAIYFSESFDFVPLLVTSTIFLVVSVGLAIFSIRKK